MRYPKSQLKESQYTSGGDFIIISSSKSYSGYYWEVNGRLFMGKNPSQYSEELLINGKVCGALTNCIDKFLIKGKKIKDIINSSNSACRKLKLSQVPVLSCNKKELLDYIL